MSICLLRIDTGLPPRPVTTIAPKSLHPLHPKTGALYKFQNRNNSPLLAVDSGTEPNRLICGSQNIFSKHKTIYKKI
jgi:hypothetical protein